MKVRPVDVALTYDGVSESGGRNRGPQVDRFLRFVGLDPDRGGPQGYAWCGAFASTCIYEAYAKDWELSGNTGPYNKKNLPVPMTAGVFEFWNKCDKSRRLKVPEPGCLYIIDHGMNKAGNMRLGHVGFIVSVDGDYFKGISGNTNGAGSREGNQVAQKRLPISGCYGFIKVE